MKKLPGFSQSKSFNRIIDANINRAKEGLRVCEEITRFVLNNRPLNARFKAIRHKIDSLSVRLADLAHLVASRQSSADVGRSICAGEFKRNSIKDLFWANIQRVKESVRVLEEFSKLIDKRASLRFKKMRYDIYEIEKDSFKKILPLSDSR